MSEMKTGRGRPKGSGLDDSVQLAAIETLLKADPTLKPTTAIKKCGVTDPSAVRRLRDKLHAARTASLDGAAVPPDVIANVSPAHVIPTQAGAASRASSISCPTAPDAQVKERSRPRMAEAAPQSEAAPQKPASNLADQMALASPQDWLARLGGLGLQAFAASFEFQWAFLGQAFRMPPVAAALKQQLFLNEMTLAMCLPGSPSPRTLH